MTHTRRTFLLTAAFGMAMLALLPRLSAQEVAISGYDPVAYFTDGAAVEGSADFTATHDGKVYRFASAQHRDAFAADPERYAPQYGGYCAFAVANGALAPVDPQAFTVVDDKLYLNLSQSIRTQWSRDIPGNIARGDANWPALKGG